MAMPETYIWKSQSSNYSRRLLWEKVLITSCDRDCSSSTTCFSYSSLPSAMAEVVSLESGKPVGEAESRGWQTSQGLDWTKWAYSCLGAGHAQGPLVNFAQLELVSWKQSHSSWELGDERLWGGLVPRGGVPLPPVRPGWQWIRWFSSRPRSQRCHHTVTNHSGIIST